MEETDVEVDVVAVDENESMNCQTLPAKEPSRLDIRREYRKLIQEMREKREELLKLDCNDLMTYLKTANSLFYQVASKRERENVSYAREAAMDSRFMALSVAIADEKASRLPTDLVQFRPEEFVEKLITKIGGRHIGENGDVVQIDGGSWKALGKYVKKFFKPTPPAFSVISGTFDASSRRRRITSVTTNKQPQACGQVENNARLQPTEDTESQKEVTEATTEEIEHVLTIIRRSYEEDPTPIDYFELVVDPQSFGKTIENIFYVSFLVKDRLLRMYIDHLGMPMIVPVDFDKPEDDEEDKRGSHQIAVSLSMDEWKEIVKKKNFEGREPFLQPWRRVKKSEANSLSEESSVTTNNETSR